MSKEKKFSLLKRLIAGLGLTLFIAGLITFALAGVGLAAGTLVATSAVLVIAPCVALGHSFLETITDIAELLIESIASFVEAVFEFFGSLF